jgi:hypothetical protein
MPIFSRQTFGGICSVCTKIPKRKKYPQSGQTVQHTEGLPDFSVSNMPKLGKYTKLNIKYTKWPQNIPNIRKIYQKAIKYTNIFHCKSLQNWPELLFFVWKYAIWQPWYRRWNSIFWLRFRLRLSQLTVEETFDDDARFFLESIWWISFGRNLRTWPH